MSRATLMCACGRRGRLTITPIKSCDWTSVLLSSLSCIAGYSLQNQVDCVVPKNHAGLSTHAAPSSPLTFLEKSPTDFLEITLKGEVVGAPHHQGEGWAVARIKQAPTHIPRHHNRPDACHSSLLSIIMLCLRKSPPRQVAFSAKSSASFCASFEPELQKHFT